jgi:small subunit ribosomal protein S1
LADHKVDSPEDVVKVGDEIEVKVLRVDVAERKVGLSRKAVGQPDEPTEETTGGETEGKAAKPRGKELRGGTGGGGQLFSLPEGQKEGEPAESSAAEAPVTEEPKPEEAGQTPA